jgi:hypothetical protein
MSLVAFVVVVYWPLWRYGWFVFPLFEICASHWRRCKQVGSLGKSVGWFDKP